MRKEFRYSQGMKIFGYIFMIGIVIGIIACFYFGLTQSKNSIWLILLGIGLIALDIFLYLDLKKRLIYVDDKIIRSVDSTSNIEYDFKDLKGFRKTDKNLIIVPELPDSKSIIITNYIGNYDELVQLISTRIPNLDLEELQESKEELLHDERLGYDETTRTENLKKLKQISRIVNIVSISLCISFFFFPKWYKYQYIACAALPVVILGIYKKHKGLIRIEEVKNDVYPTLFYSLMISITVVFLRGMLDINIFDYKNIWINFGISVVVLFVLFIVFTQEIPIKSPKALFFTGAFVFILMYAYGNLVIINYQFDKSAPTVYYSKIIDKHITSSKHTNYYVKPEKWATQKESENVDVTRKQYENIQIGDSIEIYYYKGLLHVPYFEVNKLQIN